MRRHLVPLVLVATLAAPASAARQEEAPPERGPVLVAGHVAGVVYQRTAPEGVIALDTLLVVDGNVMDQGEQPGALEKRRTWVAGVEVRCYLSTRTCELGDWFFRQVPNGSFVYDAVRGEARLNVRLAKKQVLDHYLVVSDPVPVVVRPGAGQTVDGTQLVVTGGEAVAREVSATGTLFGQHGTGGGGIVSGVLHNVYLDSPVGTRVDLSNLLP